MSKTTVHFLRKNRMIKKVKINASTGYMEFKKGFYVVSPDAINRVSKNGIMSKGSEMFFFEGNSSPRPFKKPEKNAPDPSTVYLDTMVYVNFLEQTGAPKPEAMKSAMRFIKPLFTPGSLMKIVLAVIIIGTLARSWITGLV